MPSFRLVASTALLTLSLFPSPGAAIVRRHDVPDSAYLAAEADFPALFALFRTAQGHRDCIATLIAPDWAVTAAHCTLDAPFVTATGDGGAGHPVVVAGHDNRIVEVVRFAGDRLAQGDIALLRLAETVEHVAPVPLHDRGDEKGQVVTLVGWGGRGSGNAGLETADGLFRSAENRIESASGIKLRFTFDAPGKSCAALPREGTSGPGDSGGPALLRTASGWTIAGVSSSQTLSGRPEGTYGVVENYIRISAVAGWIRAIMAR